MSFDKQKEDKSLDILKDDIKNNRIRKVYLFYGPEQYMSKHYTGIIEKALLTEELKLFNKVVLEGKLEQSSIISNCETMPAFSDKKIVLVKNSGLFKAQKKQAETENNPADDSNNNEGSGMKADSGKKIAGEKKSGSNKKVDNSFLEYLEDLPGHVCLIFVENEIDKRLKIVDAIKKAGLVVEFPWQKPDELVRWVIRIFRAAGKEISTETAAIFINDCEPGMTEIMNEIEKLKAYTGDKKDVTQEDLLKITIKSIKSKIFDITDSIVSKDTKTALKLYNDMLILKEPVQKIFFMITRQLRQLLQAKLMKSKGCNNDEIAKGMGLTPYIASKVLKQAGGFTVVKLKKLMESALEMDVAVKTGKLKDEAAVELLIISMSEF